MTLTPAQRTRRARAAAYASWDATNDRTARTANPRAAFLARFEHAADPAAARKAYFARLAKLSARARRK